MIEANATFNGTWPFKPHFSNAPGFRMHYVDEGKGEPILCLHGEPTWGYLYRNFIPKLSENYRVVVPDHMGFGKSETPQDRFYTHKTHVENLVALVKELDLKDITLVVQDWGAPIGGGLLAMEPDRVKRVFVFNGVLYPFFDMAPYAELLGTSPWFQFITQTDPKPTLENLKYTVLSIMKLIGFQNTAAVDQNWLDAYSAPFQTKEECLGAVEFPIDAISGRFATEHVMEMPSDELKARVRDMPAMLVNGIHDHAQPQDFTFGAFKDVFGEDKPMITLPNAGHFAQEDAPETLVALIEAFIQSHK